MSTTGAPFYLTDVDRYPETVYCQHDLVGENGIPEHTHSKGQLLYTEGGVVRVSTRQNTFFLPARHYMWIAPGTAHSISRGTEQVTMRNLYFPVNDDDDDFFRSTSIFPVNDLLLQMILFTTDWPNNIYGDNRNCYHFSMAIKNLLPQVSGYSLSLALPVAHTRQLKTVVAYMEKHLSEDLSFPFMAAQFNTSERTLSRLFRKDLGMSFNQYLTLQRMLAALKLLLEKDYPVKEVAAMVGYDSVPTFSHTFSKLTGVRPAKYRQLHT